VVDPHGVAVEEVVAGVDDTAGAAGHHGRALCRRDVHALWGLRDWPLKTRRSAKELDRGPGVGCARRSDDAARR